MKLTAEQIEERVHGGEPEFKDSVLGNVEFSSAMRWYRSMCNRKDAKKYAIEYFKNDALLGKLKQLPEMAFTASGFLCRLKTRGAKFTPDLQKTFEDRMAELLAAAKNAKEEKAKDSEVTVSIQDRIDEQISKMCSDIDGKLDEAFFGEFKEPVTIRGVLSQHVAKAVHARKAIEIYKKSRDELQTAFDGSDDQLKEGYESLGRNKLKKAIAQFQLVIDELQALISTSKQNRKPRVKKVKPASEIVKDVKYAKTASDGIDKFVSVNPEKIIGASQVYMYNTKYRRLGMLVADTSDGLSVSGTSITNSNKQKSVGKTLRKPGEQLKALLASKGDKFFNDIKSKPSPQTGRLNEDVLIVKVL